LVARNHAEVGFRKLFDGLAWTLKRFIDRDINIRVEGKAITINPSDWQFPSVAVSGVGLGAGSGDQATQQLMGMFAIQNQLNAEGSLLVDDAKKYNSLDQIAQSMDLRTNDFFNNPEIPQELIRAQLQKITQVAAQLEQENEQLKQRNPLAEAETVKAQASLMNATNKSEVDLLKAQKDAELKEQKLLQDKGFKEADLTYDYTKLELEHNVDIPNAGQ